METATTSSERQWILACHLSAFLGFVIPFGNVIAPLIVWQMKKNEYPAVDEHGKESVNFQLSLLLYIMISLVLILVLIGIVLLVALAIMQLILVIIAAMKADKGELYRYPFTIRFIK
ncbi:DUF4870 domain-containing protein [soil metagenome]